MRSLFFGDHRCPRICRQNRIAETLDNSQLSRCTAQSTDPKDALSSSPLLQNLAKLTESKIKHTKIIIKCMDFGILDVQRMKLKSGP